MPIRHKIIFYNFKKQSIGIAADIGEVLTHIKNRLAEQTA